MTFWRTVVFMAATDLRMEARAGEVARISIPFGLVALFLIPLALPLDNPLLQRVAWPMYWVVLLLFGMTIALRKSSLAEPGPRDALRLLGVDPAARYLGRVGASALLTFAFGLVLAPVTAVMFNAAPPPGAGRLLAIVAGVCVGLALAATLALDLTAGLRSRTTLAPLLVAPAAAMLVVPAAQASESLARGDGILLPALFIAFAVLGLAVIGVVTAAPLEESR